MLVYVLDKRYIIYMIHRSPAPIHKTKLWQDYMSIQHNNSRLTVAITFNTAAKAISLSAFVIPVFSATALTKSAFLKLTTSESFFFAAFLTAAYSEVLRLDDGVEAPFKTS